MRSPVSDPQRVGPYRIEGRLGAGGMGWVYLAHTPAGRPVALKVMRPELADSPEFRRRFAHEIAAIRAVSGAFTAAVVDADPEGDPPWLATAYVSGPTLSDAVAASGPLEEPQARRLGAGLAEALTAIHAAGIVHRDLKPSNVLLADHGPCVIDFGIALLAGVSRLTRPDARLGTPSYMSPEQIKGHAVEPSSDVFALGGVVVFAATGRTPFLEGRAHAVMFHIINDEPRLADVPPSLHGLLARCLDKDPGGRPSPAEVLAELASDTRVLPATTTWSPEVNASILERQEELVEVADRSRSTRPPLRSSLFQHARSLLEAGLTDELVREAAGRGRR